MNHDGNLPLIFHEIVYPSLASSGKKFCDFFATLLDAFQPFINSLLDAGTMVIMYIVPFGGFGFNSDFRNRTRRELRCLLFTILVEKIYVAASEY